MDSSKKIFKFIIFNKLDMNEDEIAINLLKGVFLVEPIQMKEKGG